MKKKILTILLLSATLGSALTFSGCSIPNISSLMPKNNTTLSAEMESENLSDGTIQMHSRWYSASGARLANATVIFRDGKTDICQGVTDENGNLEVVILPGNTSLTCEVSDASGSVIGTATVAFKISGEYESMSISPAKADDENGAETMQIPANKCEITAAIFITEDQRISYANISTYVSDAETDTTAEASDNAADESAQAAATTNTTDTTAPAEQ